MTQLLYDSTRPGNIPATATMVAYYCNGAIFGTTEAAVRAIFPTAHLVAIAAVPINEGDVLDVERFDATPDQAAGWVQMRRLAGVPLPWVYVNRDNRPLVEANLEAAGLTGADVALWVATLDGTQTVDPGPYPIAAVQYQDVGPYDLSVVFQAFGPGGGVLIEQGSAISIMAGTSLHQFCRGLVEADGFQHLYTRKSVAGIMQPWVKVGGNLGSSVISAGLNDQGAITVTVVGTDSKFYDFVSSDDGATWDESGPFGQGDGLNTLSATNAPATPTDLSSVMAAFVVLNVKTDALATKLAGLTLKAE